MRLTLLFGYLSAASLVYSSFFTAILRGIITSGRYTNLLSHLTTSVLSDLQSSDSAAGLFVCQILDAEDDFASLTSLIVSLPTLAPEILNEIEQGGDDVAGFVDELVTNPAAAFTVVVGGVEAVVGAVETFVTGIPCNFGIDCPATTTQPNSAAMVLSSTCQGILANAAVASTTLAAAPSSTASAASSTTAPSAASSTFEMTLSDSTAPSAAATSPLTSSVAADPSTAPSPTPPSQTPIQLANGSPTDYGSTRIWLWLAPLSALCGVMLLL
ncbi:mucin 5B, oligomeric mucus gel-forming [Lambiella insularis]|nr:mucin 5B, oligomeric mucus gel-forming [Lambiella insularis]